jgi:HSP20 family protein
VLFDPFVPFDQLLPRTLGRVGFVPPADIAVSDGDLVLTMDLPGLTADDVGIEVLDGFLTVRGERRRPELGDGSSWAHAERGFGAFERRVKLPDGVDPDAVTASMDHGVLSLIVPKPERMKPRTVAIKAGSQRELAQSTS